MPTNRFSASWISWRIDPAKPDSDVTAIWSQPWDFEHPITPEPAPPTSSPDRIWDMLVLAARSSRYGD